MKIIKRSSQDILKEEVHGGNGARKLLATDKRLHSLHFDAMTHGFLPPGNWFDWHNYINIEAVMYLLRGIGTVSAKDGVSTSPNPRRVVYSPVS